jgi:hypothetical protein
MAAHTESAVKGRSINTAGRVSRQGVHNSSSSSSNEAGSNSTMQRQQQQSKVAAAACIAHASTMQGAAAQGRDTQAAQAETGTQQAFHTRCESVKARLQLL